MRRPTRRGGPGAIAGFLYQILGAVDWAVAGWAAPVWLEVKGCEDRDPDTATMVLEPPGGADARYEAGTATKVVQYKLREGSGLSARDLCREVLPDLWRAAAVTDATNAIFELQANRPLGPSGTALVELFGSLCVGEPPVRPLERLPDGHAVLRIGNVPTSPHDAFLKALAGCLGIEEGQPLPADDLDGQQRLWRLLAHFRVAEPVAARDLARRVDDVLRRLIDYPEDAANARGALVTALMERAGRGGARLTVEWLFGIVGVTREQAAARLFAPRRLSEMLHDTLRDRRYDPALDVRSELEVRDAATTVVIIGESGVGKSWRLYRMARDLDRSGEAVVLCRARTLRDMEEQAVNLVWHYALGRSQSLRLAALPDRWREMTGREGTPRLWIYGKAPRASTRSSERSMLGGRGTGSGWRSRCPRRRCPGYWSGRASKLARSAASPLESSGPTSNGPASTRRRPRPTCASRCACRSSPRTTRGSRTESPVGGRPASTRSSAGSGRS